MEENNQNTNTPPVESSPIEQNNTPPVQKKFKLPIVIAGIVLLLVIGTASAVFLFVSKPKQAACTMEAKICPDGTSVGRTGPNCEFSPCPPTSTTDMNNWKTYTNPVDKYSLKYPPDWIIFSDGVTTLSNHEISETKNPEGWQQGDLIPDYYSLEISRHDEDSVERGIAEFGTTNVKAFYENFGTSKEINVPFSAPFIKRRVDNYNLNGISAKKVEEARELTLETLLILRGGSIYKISIYPYDAVENETIKQILSTFRFIN